MGASECVVSEEVTVHALLALAIRTHHLAVVDGGGDAAQTVIGKSEAGSTLTATETKIHHTIGNVDRTLSGFRQQVVARSTLVALLCIVGGVNQTSVVGDAGQADEGVVCRALHTHTLQCLNTTGDGGLAGKFVAGNGEVGGALGTSVVGVVETVGDVLITSLAVSGVMVVYSTSNTGGGGRVEVGAAVGGETGQKMIRYDKAISTLQTEVVGLVHTVGNGSETTRTVIRKREVVHTLHTSTSGVSETVFNVRHALLGLHNAAVVTVLALRTNKTLLVKAHTKR